MTFQREAITNTNRMDILKCWYSATTTSKRHSDMKVSLTYLSGLEADFNPLNAKIENRTLSKSSSGET